MQEKRSCEKTCAPGNARDICHEPANASESNGNKRKQQQQQQQQERGKKGNLT